MLERPLFRQSVNFSSQPNLFRFCEGDINMFMEVAGEILKTAAFAGLVSGPEYSLSSYWKKGFEERK